MEDLLVKNTKVKGLLSVSVFGLLIAAICQRRKLFIGQNLMSQKPMLLSHSPSDSDDEEMPETTSRSSAGAGPARKQLISTADVDDSDEEEEEEADGGEVEEEPGRSPLLLQHPQLIEVVRKAKN